MRVLRAACPRPRRTRGSRPSCRPLMRCGEPVDVADDRIERARREHRRVGVVGRGEHGHGAAPSCARAGGRTAARGAARRPGRARAPRRARASCASAASSSSSSCARSRRRRGSTSATSAPGGSRSGSRCSSAREPRQPRLHAVEGLALGEPFPLLAPHGSVRQQLARRAPAPRRSAAVRAPGRSTRRRGRRSSAGRRPRTATGGRPRRPRGRCAPGGRRSPGTRRRSSPAPRPRRALRPGTRAGSRSSTSRSTSSSRSSCAPGVHDDRLDVLDVRTEALHERAHGRDDDRGQVVAAGAQPPHHPEAPAHRLGRGRDALERQRLPRREELDRVVAEVLRAGRPRRRSASTPVGTASTTGRRAVAARERRREDGARGLGNRHRAALPPGRRRRQPDRRRAGRQWRSRVISGRHRDAHAPRVFASRRLASGPETLQTPNARVGASTPRTSVAAPAAAESGRPSASATCAAICQSVNADVNSSTRNPASWSSLPRSVISSNFLRSPVVRRSPSPRARASGRGSRRSIRRSLPVDDDRYCATGNGTSKRRSASNTKSSSTLSRSSVPGTRRPSMSAIFLGLRPGARPRRDDTSCTASSVVNCAAHRFVGDASERPHVEAPRELRRSSSATDATGIPRTVHVSSVEIKPLRCMRTPGRRGRRFRSVVSSSSGRTRKRKTPKSERRLVRRKRRRPGSSVLRRAPAGRTTRGTLGFARHATARCAHDARARPDGALAARLKPSSRTWRTATRPSCVTSCATTAASLARRLVIASLLVGGKRRRPYEPGTTSTCLVAPFRTAERADQTRAQRAGVVAVHGGCRRLRPGSSRRRRRLLRSSRRSRPVRACRNGSARGRRRVPSTAACPRRYGRAGTRRSCRCCLIDRRPLWPGEAAAFLHLQHRGRQVELVVHDHDRVGLDVVAPDQRAARPDRSRSCTSAESRARRAARRCALRRRARAPAGPS